MDPRKVGKVKFEEVEGASSKLLVQALNWLQSAWETLCDLNCLADAEDEASLVYYLEIESSRVEQCESRSPV